MTVGILLVTHSGVGEALLRVVYNSFDTLPIEIRNLSVCNNPDPKLLTAKASQLVNYLEKGDGVLVLTDMFGSTPSNIAQSLQEQGHPIKVIAGLNLPMLFKILNYPFLKINDLAEKALIAGQNGVFEPIPDFIINKSINLKKSYSHNLAKFFLHK